MSRGLANQVRVRFSAAELARIDAIVSQQPEMTRSGLVRIAVEEYCKTWERDHPDPPPARSSSRQAAEAGPPISDLSKPPIRQTLPRRR